ncbi:hypothetical protein GW796_10305 [archaeon]|nr:hypothetical protein [archaeon]
MYKINKNDKAFKELDSYAKTQNTPLKEVLLSDAHLEKVSDIFYSNMPKMIKWSMKKEKFTDFYKNHREQFVSQMNLA